MKDWWDWWAAAAEVALDQLDGLIVGTLVGMMLGILLQAWWTS